MSCFRMIKTKGQKKTFLGKHIHANVIYYIVTCQRGGVSRKPARPPSRYETRSVNPLAVRKTLTKCKRNKQTIEMNRTGQYETYFN